MAVGRQKCDDPLRPMPAPGSIIRTEYQPPALLSLMFAGSRRSDSSSALPARPGRDRTLSTSMAWFTGFETAPSPVSRVALLLLGQGQQGSSLYRRKRPGPAIAGMELFGRPGPQYADRLGYLLNRHRAAWYRTMHRVHLHLAQGPSVSAARFLCASVLYVSDCRRVSDGHFDRMSVSVVASPRNH